MIPPFVDADWLIEHRDDVVVADVRTTMFGDDAVADFAGGHLPGAALVVLDRDLAGPPAGVDGRHPLPTPAELASHLGAAGIADDATVIAYDDRGGAFAARLVWMLRSIGQPAALLDGGLDAWPAEVERGTRSPNPVERRARPWPSSALADAAAVAAHIAGGGVVIDSRDAPRYAGESEPIDARAGHVPGAINVPFAGNVDAGGRLLPTDALARRFAVVDERGDDAPIVYCGSGVTACHNALAMEAAGVASPRLYVASWSGWSTDPDRPVATGPHPTS